jgi:hypothetical protein
MYKGRSSETWTGVQKYIQYVFDNNHYTTVITHGWQYERGYRYWLPLFRHLSQRCTSFVIPSAKKGHVLLDEPLFHCLSNCLIEIELPALQSLLQWPKHVIVTRGDIRAVRGVIQNNLAKTRRVSRVARAACGRALSWSISTPQASFSVIQGQLLALLPHASMFHLNNPYTWKLYITYSKTEKICKLKQLD